MPRRVLADCSIDDLRLRRVSERGEISRPCTRIGLGGPCPHCDEPIAITDLLNTEVTSNPQPLT